MADVITVICGEASRHPKRRTLVLYEFEYAVAHDYDARWVWFIPDRWVATRVAGSTQVALYDERTTTMSDPDTPHSVRNVWRIFCPSCGQYEVQLREAHLFEILDERRHAAEHTFTLRALASIVGSRR